jgi:hypothetical protein
MKTNATIEDIYDQHVRALPLAKRLQLAERIVADAAAEAEPRRSLLELEGLGAQLWHGVDADEHVNALRDEWDPDAAGR